MKRIAANYFDGKTARRHPAELSIDAGELLVRGAFGERRVRRSEVDISEAMGGAPRMIHFADGAGLEVIDRLAFDAWLREAGFGESAVVRLQGRWSAVLASLMMTLLALAAAYVWGLPWLSGIIAPHLPVSMLQSLSQNTLDFLDKGILQPSRLPARRQAELTEAAGHLVDGQPDLPAYRVHFRSSSLGPNAFALPGGDIVVFDELVALSRDDDEVAAVIAHELGHVAYRHGVRQLIQSSVVSFCVGLYLGDVSSLASGFGTLLLQSRYSRAFEREADDYAARILLGAGRNGEPLAALLERMDDAYKMKRGGQAAGWEGFSSHPDSAERVARLRALR